MPRMMRFFCGISIMKITKIGHCCLLIETKGKRILTDPGMYSVEQHSKVTNIDFNLFTHEHPDHYHLDSLKIILQNNPQTKIYANDSVSALLSKENIEHVLVKHGETLKLDEIDLKGIGEKHAVLHGSIPQSTNTGYFIDGRLWYPGDAFTNPEMQVEILALPVMAPWLKVSESMDYAISLKPKFAIPVHDAVRYGFTHDFAKRVLGPNDIEFFPMIEGDEKDFN